MSKENYTISKNNVLIHRDKTKRAKYMTQNLILASTSSYRAALLAQLGVSFDQIDPRYDEAPLSEEEPYDMAARLAKGKALSGSNQHASQTKGTSNSIIIGSDQVAHLNGRVFGKPGNFERAQFQLASCAGQWVRFTTAVCLANTKGEILSEGVENYDIKYRPLSEDEIECYLRADMPYDCAGSIKAEGLGITIIDEGRGKDINTLYGLPLILLSKMLRTEGYNLSNNIN
ncbi:MAG: septum formation protein [Candidatus Azotimanducaceae bacterium]